VITGRRAYPKWLVRALVVFAIGMTVLASIASREHHATENARNAALSELVAVNAQRLKMSDPSLSMQLALVAYGLSQTPAARSELADITAGELPTRLLGPSGSTLLALGDDGHRVALGYVAENRIAIYSLRYSQLTLLTSVPGGYGTARVDAIALSDNGHLLAVGNSSGRVALWSLTSVTHPKRLAVLRAGAAVGNWVNGLSFSPAGGALAAASADGSVQRWSLANPAQPAPATALVAPGRTALDAVSYSHDGNTLTAVGGHGRLVVWSAHGGTKPLASETIGGDVLSSVSYSPDGHTLAVGGADNSVALMTLSASGDPGAPRTSLSAGSAVTSLAFSRDGRYLAAGTADRSTRIWSAADGTLVARLPHPASVTGVAFSDGDRHLLSTDSAGTTRIWEFPPPSTYRFASAISTLSYSSTTPRLTVGLASSDNDIGNVVDEWRPAPVGAWYAAPASAAPLDAYWLHPSGVITMTTTSPTGTVTSGTTTTASGTTTTGTKFVVTNPHAGEVALRRTEAHTTVMGGLLSPNDEFYAASANDRRIWLWNVLDPAHPTLVGKLSGFPDGIGSWVYSHSGQTLFVSSGQTIRIWSLSSTASPSELPSSPLTGPATGISTMALSPDGHTLAAATAGGSVWLWSVANASKASLSDTLTAATGQLDALSFSPSDNVLVAGGDDRRLTFWHYRPYQDINRLCALSGTPITPYEWSLYVPGVAYKPPCAKWTPPVAKTVTVTTPSP
jgi:WD40 repeat protein